MKTFDISRVDFGKLHKQMPRYEKKWIAISEKNTIVASGKTYGEALERARERKDAKGVILFKVPPLNYSLAP